MWQWWICLKQSLMYFHLNLAAIGVYCECISKWHRVDKRFPSLQSVNHNTQLTPPPSDHFPRSRWSNTKSETKRKSQLQRRAECKGGSRCGRESNFLTVFIELRCLSGHSVLCVCYSATLSCSFLTMMIMCKHCVLPRLARQGVN